MTLDDVRRLFAYDAWANRETLRSLTSMDAPPPQGVRWIAHIAAAHALWWERTQSAQPSSPVWPEWGLERTASALDEAEHRWSTLLAEAGEAGLGRAVAYVNSKGERFESRLVDILTHVAFHGTYHRGQIAAAVRAAGGEPAYTDFIHAVRTGVIE